MTRVLFFDIDGTLIDTQGGAFKIPEGAKRKMKELQEQGDLLFIASGRPYAFIPKELSDFGFDGMILCNGAHVELQGKIIYHQPIKTNLLKELINKLNRNNFEYIIETKRYAYLNPKFNALNDFFMSCNINENYLCKDFNEDEVLSECLKLEANIPVNCHKMIEEMIEEDFSHDKHGTDNAFEIYSNVISKAMGMRKVIDYFNLDIEKSYAFGDGLNDIEMIKMAGNGIAMGNAVDELKKVSDIVCDTVQNNGLEKILIELFE